MIMVVVIIIIIALLTKVEKSPHLNAPGKVEKVPPQ